IFSNSMSRGLSRATDSTMHYLRLLLAKRLCSSCGILTLSALDARRRLSLAMQADLRLDEPAERRRVERGLASSELFLQAPVQQAGGRLLRAEQEAALRESGEERPAARHRGGAAGG